MSDPVTGWLEPFPFLCLVKATERLTRLHRGRMADEVARRLARQPTDDLCLQRHRGGCCPLRAPWPMKADRQHPLTQHLVDDALRETATRLRDNEWNVGRRQWRGARKLDLRGRREVNGRSRDS